MMDSISVRVPDVAVGPLSGSMFAILMGPDGMFEHMLEPPPDVAPPDVVAPAAEVPDEPLELHAASPNASNVPAAIGSSL